MSFHKHFLIWILIPYLGGHEDQVSGQIKIAKQFVIHHFRIIVEDSTPIP